MNKIFIYLFFIIFAVGSCIAADFTYNINASELPFNKTEPITIRYITNTTLNITTGNYTSANITFLNFNNTNQTDFDVKINITRVNESGNYADYVMLYNTAANFTSYITFMFNITGVINITTNATNQTNTTINATNQTNVSEFVQIDINNFEYTVCDYMLPYNATKDISVVGRAGQTVYTDYDINFFSIPTSFVIPDINYSIVKVNIHLANLSNLSVGNYTKPVRFSIISNYSNVTFRFIIQTCVRPPPTYSELVRVCGIVDKTPEEQLKCLQLQAEYDQQLYESMLSATKAKVINNTVKEYVNVTVRTPVLDLGDPDIIQALKDIPVTWKQMITDQNQKTKQIENLSTELNSLKQGYTSELAEMRNESERRITDSLKVLTEQQMIKDNTIQMYEDKYIKRAAIWKWIGIIVFIGLCIGAFILYNENTWW